MFRRLIVGVTLLCCLATLWTTMSSAHRSHHLTIIGSSTLLPLGQKVVEVMKQRDPDLGFAVAGSGTADGVRAMLDGTTDVALCSRRLTVSEREMVQCKGLEIKEHLVALDCIVAIVDPSNPLNDISLSDLKGVYTGHIRSWAELGGADAPIVVLSRNFNSGTLAVFLDRVLDGKRIRPDASMLASNGAMAQAVAGNRFAIGYLGLAYLNPDLKALAIDHVEPAPAAILDHSYPLSRGLYVLTTGDPRPAVRDFLNFLRSDAGRRIIEEEGFLPVGDSSFPVAASKTP